MPSAMTSEIAVKEGWAVAENISTSSLMESSTG
jgi:hypothetical protein